MIMRPKGLILELLTDFMYAGNMIEVAMKWLNGVVYWVLGSLAMWCKLMYILSISYIIIVGHYWGAIILHSVVCS